FSDRDEWLRYAIISDVLFYLYQYFASNINSLHRKEMQAFPALKVPVFVNVIYYFVVYFCVRLM
ncbi:hypothetical protein PDQ02_23655, partial [Escherichia coli]|nr:hypothetical protein [Escherichia coli]